MTPTHEAAFETVIETHLLANGYVPVMAGMTVRAGAGAVEDGRGG